LRDGEGLENAQQILQDVQDRVPEQAQPGVQTAIDNNMRFRLCPCI
jgi:hypothetical protein